MSQLATEIQELEDKIDRYSDQGRDTYDLVCQLQSLYAAQAAERSSL